MSLVEDFDTAAAHLRKAVDDAEQRIADAAPNQRPAMERKLAEALTSVEHLQPLGTRSRDLRESASEEGIYSAQNLGLVNTRFALEGRDKLTAALDGTGIDPVEVEARMRVGANSAALEARWVQHDLQSVADLRGLDLRDQTQLQQAIAVVDAAYDRVADAYGVDDAIHGRAASQHGEPIETAAMAKAQREIDAEDVTMSVEADRVHNHLDPSAQIERSRQTDALENAPTTSVGSRDGLGADYAELARYARPVGAEDERRLREAIERALTRDELDRLKSGDVEVLRGVGDRDDQLAMARDYLRAAGDPAARHGLERVSEQLSEERERQRQERGHEGGGHE